MFRLELIDVTKRYPGVTANDRVNLQVLPGEIHAVLGENGAGKSTLMKIICGAVSPDEGEMRWNGAPAKLGSPRDARALGIAMVFQHFSLFESLTVAQNVWLGLARRSSLADVSAEIRRVGSEYGLPIDPERPVHGLSVGERQRVETLRALLAKPELLILDEPTSVLTPGAVTQLFETLRQLSARGCSILYISHKLAEIKALCHSCTVLRGGRVTGNVDPRRETTGSLARLMIGDDPPRLERRPRAPGAPGLVVEQLSLDKSDPFGTALRAISFTVHQGEVLGVAGVSGNGQKELLAVLSGEDPRAPSGTVRLFGNDIGAAKPARRRALGLSFVPEERLGRATVPTLSLAHNALLTRTEPVRRGGWLDMLTLFELTGRLIAENQVKARGADATAKSLSGGNLQKFIMAREIGSRPQSFIVSQPTWGVDVGASAQIRSQLLALRDAGCAVLVVSEELDELFEICDALVVISEGRVSPRMDLESASVARIGEWMSGLWPAAAPCNPTAPSNPAGGASLV